MVTSFVNHVSVVADDIEESTEFYTEVFDMERVPTPDFDFDVAWLRVNGERGQLHLFTLDAPAPRYHHFGLLVDDFETVYERANDRDAVTDVLDSGRETPLYAFPDGSVQLYVNDPSGNVVEVNWPDADTLEESIRERIVYREELFPQSETAKNATLGLGNFPVDP